VDLAHPRPDARRGLHLGDLGIDEDAGHDPRLGQTGHHAGEPRLLCHHVEPALGGDLVAPLGHQHRHLGPQRAGDADHLVGGGHLEVELHLSELAQAAHVLVLDVAPILAQVHGDAVGPAQVGLHRRPHRIGLEGTAGLPQRGHVVDIDAQFDHSSCNSFNTRRDCSGWPPR
jgi:hypothetical protein